MVRIRLNYPQMSMVAHVANLRRLYNLYRMLEPKHGGDGAWDHDINACASECALAQYLNLHWDGAVGDFKAYDVGGMVEVRSVAEEHHRLRLHPEDKDDAPYTLAYVDRPNVYLIGWMFGRNGKQQEFWGDPTGTNRHAFFAPQSILNQMPLLREWVIEERARRAAAA